MSILIAESRLSDRQVEYRILTQVGNTIHIERRTVTQTGFNRLLKAGELHKFNTSK
jgi:hypothetical protein